MDSPVVATLRLSYVGRRATRQTTGGAEGATSRHHASDLGAPLGGHVRAVEGARRSAADVASRRHCEGLRRTRTIAQPSRTAPAHALQKARREPGTRLLVAYRRGLPHVPVGLPRRPRSKLTTGAAPRAELVTASVEQILDTLSERVRYFTLARRVDDLWIEERNRAEVCTLVERLLGAHLRATREWDSSAWVEAIVLDGLEVSDAGVAALAGAAIWCGRDGWFLDPLAARFELSADRQWVSSYVVRFGDAELGLGAMRYRGPKPAAGPLPSRWRFVFEDSRPPGPTRSAR